MTRLVVAVASAGLTALTFMACAADVRLGDLATNDSGTTPADAPTVDAAAEVDAPDTDAACDCKGNPCSAGRCLPLVLSPGGSDPVYLTADAANLYYATNGHAGTPADPNVVYRVAKSGGAPTALNADGGFVRGIVVDDTLVYWVRSFGTSGSVGCASKVDGSSKRLIGGFGGTVDVRDLEGDSDDLFLTSITQVRNYKKSATGSPGTQVTNLLSSASGLVVDGTSLFVADTTAGSVAEVSRISGTTTTKASPLDAPSLVASDATHLYVAGNGFVSRVAKTGSVIEPVVTPFGAVGDLALDPTTVYFSTSSIIAKVAKGSTSATTLVSNLTAGASLVVDDDFVYFADRGSGAISRIPK